MVTDGEYRNKRPGTRAAPSWHGHLFWYTPTTHGITITYISRKISIGHPSVGLASLAQLWINRKNRLQLSIKGQKSDGRLQIWRSIQVSLHKEPPEVGLVKKLTGSLY